MTGKFRLRGRHVLASLLGFFAVIMTANGIFLTYAIRSFPGQQVEKSYLQGLHFNEEIAAQRRQQELGWSAAVEARFEAGSATVEIALSDKEAAPLTNLVIRGELRRPASEREDRKLTFAASVSGLYRAEAMDLTPGAYDIFAVATSPAGDEFKIEKRIMLQ